MEVINKLVEKADRSAAEEAYLGALTALVETYADAHVEIPPTRGVAARRSLMAEQRLSQAEFAPLVGHARARVGVVMATYRRRRARETGRRARPQTAST